MFDVADGEHRARHLEQHEVEGGLEVPGEIRLDDGRPDRAQVVAEADADAGFLARLGLAIAGHCHRCGDGRGGDMGGLTGGIPGGIPGGIRVVAVAGLRAGVVGLRLLRHVLRLDQAVTTWSVPSWATVTRQPAIPEILAPVYGAGLDAALDLVEAGLDGLGFGEQFFRPAVVVGLGEFGLAGLQSLDPGLLLRGALGGLRFDAAVAGCIAHSTSIIAIAHFQRVASSSAAAWSFSVASFSSSTGSSNQTPLSSSRANRSRRTWSPAAS